MTLGDPVRGAALYTRLRLTLPRRTAGFSLPRFLEGAAASRPFADGPGAIWGMKLAERVLERLPIRRTCYFRSLARFAVLRRAGVPVTFVMGVRDGAPDIEGHAWLALDGGSWGEPAPSDFVPTFTFPARAVP